MPAKPKPRPSPRRDWQARAVTRVRAHPLLTWSTVASIVAVAGGLWTGGAWFFGRFQLAEAADAFEKKVQQANIEQRYEVQGVKSLILGNRVIACRSGKTRGIAPDAATCQEAEQQYKASTDRERDLYRETLKGK